MGGNVCLGKEKRLRHVVFAECFLLFVSLLPLSFAYNDPGLDMFFFAFMIRGSIDTIPKIISIQMDMFIISCLFSVSLVGCCSYIW